MKMNSIAFKSNIESKNSARDSSRSRQNSLSSLDENERGFKFSSSKNVERSIISPIRCDGIALESKYQNFS